MEEQRASPVTAHSVFWHLPPANILLAEASHLVEFQDEGQEKSTPLLYTLFVYLNYTPTHHDDYFPLLFVAVNCGLQLFWRLLV